MSLFTTFFGLIFLSFIFSCFLFTLFDSYFKSIILNYFIGLNLQKVCFIFIVLFICLLEIVILIYRDSRSRNT